VRILYVSHTLPPRGAILKNAGGMQRVSRQLIDQWNGCDDIELITEAVNVSGRGFIGLQTSGFLTKLLITLTQKARRVNADIILFSSMVTASLAFFLQNRVDIPMVTINHGRDVTLDVKLYQRFVPHVFQALDGVISVSNATKQECIKRGMKPGDGIALSNGFDVSAMENLPDKEASRSILKDELNIHFDGKKVLLTVGRLVKRKGHAWFIREVFSKLPANVIYLIIGDGPEKGDIKSLAHRRLKDRIFLLGRQPDRLLKLAYRAADVFIMPNIPVQGDMEGFGIVLLEANLAGTPAAASDLEGIKDVVTNGQNGYKVDPLNETEFLETIKIMLNGNLEQFGRNARQYVKQNFSWNQVAQNYATYLTRIITRFKSNQSKLSK
jgi:phosphatidylinositol alpha-1,6-mannosyltransferase